MRISNPPAGAGSSVVVQSIGAPTAFTTDAHVTVSVGTMTAVTVSSDTYETIISNLDATNTIYVQDQVSAVAGDGVPVGPNGTGIFTCRANLNLCSTAGSNIKVNINRTRNV